MTRVYKVGRMWYGDWSQGGVRIRRPLSPAKEVAVHKLKQIIEDRDADTYGRRPGAISWADFRKKYLEFSRGAKAENTFKRDTAALDALERFHKLRQLGEITPELLERWKSARRAEGRGPATINRDIGAVKAMMKKAREWGYIGAWSGASVKSLRESRGRLLFYSPEEVARLLSVCESRMSGFYDWTTICLLGVRAGLRRAEIYWLAWADVDLSRNILSVVAKDGWQPKTGEQRHVPIPPDLARRLKGLKQTTPWVIGERPSLPVMSAFFRKISRKAKLAGNLHTLRHTYASHLAQAGVDLYTLGKLLGHTDPTTTTIYAHLSPKTYHDAVAKLPKIAMPVFMPTRAR